MSRFLVYITPEAHSEIKELPGNVRHRIRRIIDGLANQPYPAQSKHLEFNDPDRQLFRIRLNNWRIVYCVTEFDSMIDVLAVRKRPPYDYGDLSKLLEGLE